MLPPFAAPVPAHHGAGRPAGQEVDQVDRTLERPDDCIQRGPAEARLRCRGLIRWPLRTGVQRRSLQREGWDASHEVHPARTQISCLLDAVHAGETIPLMKGGRPWDRLMPLSPRTAAPAGGPGGPSQPARHGKPAAPRPAGELDTLGVALPGRQRMRPDRHRNGLCCSIRRPCWGGWSSRSACLAPPMRSLPIPAAASPSGPNRRGDRHQAATGNTARGQGTAPGAVSDRGDPEIGDPTHEAASRPAGGLREVPDAPILRQRMGD